MTRRATTALEAGAHVRRTDGRTFTPVLASSNRSGASRRRERNRQLADHGDWPLLGREHELGLAAETLTGDHRFGLLISGPFGCGRSRLLAEIARLAVAEGLDVIRAAGSPGGCHMSLLPLLILLDGALLTSVDTDSLMRSLWRSLARRSARRPVALVVDDVEGLDNDSLVFLHQAATQHVAKVIGAVRSDISRLSEVEAVLSPPVFDFREVPDLSGDEIGCLVQLAFGDELTAHEKEQVVVACSGRPRILAGLVESATGGRTGGHNEVRVWPPAPCETDLRHFKQVISALQADAPALVALISCLGELPRTLLRDVCAQALESATAAGLVTSDPCGRIRPAHVVVSEAVRTMAIEATGLAAKLIAALEHRPVGDLEATELRGRLALDSAASLDPIRVLAAARAASLLGHHRLAVQMLDRAWAVNCDAATALMRELFATCWGDGDAEPDLAVEHLPPSELALLAAADQATVLPAFADVVQELLAPEDAAAWFEQLGAIACPQSRPYVAVRHAETLVALGQYAGAAAEACEHVDSSHVEVTGTALSVHSLFSVLSGDVRRAHADIQRVQALAAGVSEPAALLTIDTAVRAGLAAALLAALSGRRHRRHQQAVTNAWLASFVDVRDRVLAGLVDDRARTDPDAVPGRVLPWWRRRAHYVAAAGAGDLVTALSVAGSMPELDAESSGPPVLAMLTLHDLLRMGDRRAAQRIRDLMTRTGPLFADLPFCRAVLCHAIGVIDEDCERMREAAWLFGEVSATQQAQELQRLVAGRSTHPFGGPGGAPAGTTGSDRLTPRELEVATLAALGLSNRAIASRLSVSHRTVENQLSRTYAKLGICGRNELSAALRA